MAQAVIAFLGIATLVVMSIRANSRFRDVEKLPMQWSLKGAVNWTAPRKVALSLTPILGAIILIFIAISSVMLEPRPGQEGLEVPITIVVALTLFAVHALHLHLIAKTLNSNRK